MSQNLMNLYAESTGKASDKWTLYVSEYDRLFEMYRENSVRILEIGIQNGGSLEIWSEYFQHLQLAVGCDVDPAISKLKYTNPCIKLVVGDIKLESTQEQILEHSNSFNIMIDDGSHQSLDIISTFVQYFPYLEDEGIYVIEDLHCSYWAEFKGGLFDPFSSMAFFKCLTDIVNYEHWGVEKNRVEILKRFESEYGIKIDEKTLTSIHSIEFINSMCVIRKADPNANQLGSRIFSGKIDSVAMCLNGEYTTTLNTPDQADNKWTFRSSSTEDELIKRTAAVSKLNSEIQKRDKEIEYLNLDLEKYENSISWTVTKPLRLSRRILSRVLDKINRISNSPREKFSTYLKARSDKEVYLNWIKSQDALRKNIITQRDEIKNFEYQPLISILLPVYKIEKKIFQETIDSVLAQSYQNWHVCIAFANPDDKELLNYIKTISAQDDRFKTVYIENNEGISSNSNACLELAEGEFISLLDHDDILAPFALYEMVKKLNQSPDFDFLYSDKDSINESSSERLNALLKPEWSPEIMYSVNYLTHFNVIRRRIVEQIGGFRSETDGAQDWDLFLRISQVTERFARVPGVFYHWRIHSGSTSSGIEAKPYALAAQLKTIQDHVAFLELNASVKMNKDSGFRLIWEQSKSTTVDLIIDAESGNSEQLNSLIEKVLSQNVRFQINIICVLSADFVWEIPPEIKISQTEITVLKYSGSQNKTSVIKRGVEENAGECLVFLSDSVNDLNEICLEELVGWTLHHPDICFTSSLILGPNGLVEEAGLVVDKSGRGTPMFKGSLLRQWGWFGGPLWYRNCSASSPWAVAVSRVEYEREGGFDTCLNFKQAFISLCQSMRKSGKRGLVNPHSRATLFRKPENNIPPFDESLSADPYFHPYFSSLQPLELKH